MKYTNLLFIALLLTFAACNSDSSGGATTEEGATAVSADLAALEKEVNEKTTPENAQKLLAAYTAEVAKHPEDADAVLAPAVLAITMKIPFPNNSICLFHGAAPPKPPAPQGLRPQTPVLGGCAPKPLQWLRFLLTMFPSIFIGNYQ